MGDSSELAQAAISEPIFFGKPVFTLFANISFMEQVRVDFDPSLWRTQIPEGGDSSTPLLIIYAIYIFYGYLNMNKADSELFWIYKKKFHDWSPEWFRRLDAKLRTAFKQILWSRGVYTGSNHSQIYRQLADLKDLDSPPEWPEEERREEEFVATSRFSEASQEREAQKQIRRD
jgi:hypothetical protein